MNKKIIMPLMMILGISVVAAIGYYSMFSTSFTVLPSINIEGELEQELGEVYDGDIVVGDSVTLTNEAPNPRDLIITNDAGEGIITSYISDLELSKKDTTTWGVIGDPIEITYTVVGDDFEVIGVPEGYTAIYYKDEVVGLEGRIENPQPAISIVGVGNLPQLDDANVDEFANYCAEPDNYNQCKGAKLWVVPTTDLTDSNLNWANMANYYYELDLIQYNSDGEITLSPGASLTITPVYEIGPGVIGEQIITTTVA